MTPRQLTWSTNDGVTTLSGVIDEFADLPSLSAELKTPEVTFDLGGVTRINSIGVRSWVELMRSLAGKSVRLIRCSGVFVEQLNAILGFAGGARVESVLLPYSCAKCGSHTVELALRGRDALNDVQLERPCPRCGAPAEFDDLPERYLNFTRY